jgi:hypothetical protein
MPSLAEEMDYHRSDLWGRDESPTRGSGRATRRTPADYNPIPEDDQEN